MPPHGAEILCPVGYFFYPFEICLTPTEQLTFLAFYGILYKGLFWGFIEKPRGIM